MPNESPSVTEVTNREDLTTRRIQVFQELYGTNALYLAYHAAFPLTLTSDLLYCLRETFVPDCPWYVVADVLLSNLCQPAGYDLYQIEGKTRNRLLRDLCRRFGEQRLKELAKFMSEYINHRLSSEPNNNRALVFGHRPDWTALAYLNSDQKEQEELINTIKQELLNLENSPDGKDRIRWGVLVENYADLLSEKGFKPPLTRIAQNILDGEPIRDDEEKSIEELMKISLQPFEYEVAEINPDITPDDESEDELQSFEFKTVTVNARGEEINQEQKQAFYFLEFLGEAPGKQAELQIEMVAIPGGTFKMGSPENEPKRDESESPQHTVTVQPFFMSKYPVTQSQWRFVAKLPQVNRELEPEPSYFKEDIKGDIKGDNLPVEQVSWYDAVEFCDRLSEYTGRTYTLPSEAEWEYACRAGTTTPFYFGETITGELANYDASRTFAKESESEYRQRTTTVGQFPPNAFGLYDMHGNLWEWCLDDWHENYEGAPTDGSAWLKENDNRSQDEIYPVLRGGSWVNYPESCRSASRNADVWAGRDYVNAFGFRVVCVVGRALK